MKQNFVCFNNMVHKNTIKFILKHGGFNKIIRATCFFINDKIKRSNINFEKNKLILGKYKFQTIDNDEGISTELQIYQSHEPLTTHLMIKELKQDMFCLDLGSNIGYYAVIESNIVGESGKIFAIEPTKYAFEKMKKNFDLNQEFAKNIYPEQIFLSTLNKKLPLGVYSSWNLDLNSEQHSKHKGIKKETIDSKIYTLDEFTDLKNIKDVDFIKLDVDGFELDVIKGGSKYLKMFKPPIFMELAPYLYNEFGYSIDELINNLRSLNYEFYDIKKLTKIKDIHYYSKKINDGSSTNILLL